MGFFSSIGKAIGGVASKIGDVISSPLGSTALDVGSSIYSYAQTKEGLEKQNEMYQANAREAAAFNAAEAEKNRTFQKNWGLGTRHFNRVEAAANRKFQQRLSNSAHQRQVADLRRAGLNPILSAKYGGASVPPGATATGTNVSGAAGSMSAAPAVDTVGPALASALNVARTTATNRLTGAQTRTEAARPGQVEAQTKLATEQAGAAFEEARQKQQASATEYWRTVNEQERVDVTRAQAEEAKARARAARAKARLDEAAEAGAANEESIQQALGEWAKVLEMIMPGANSAFKAFIMRKPPKGKGKR